MKKVTLKAPNGSPIIGTLEKLSGVGLIQDEATVNDSGDLEVVFAGETKIWWDEQKTVFEKGERIFIDEEGNHWGESALKLEPVKPSEHFRDGFKCGLTWPARWDHKPGGPHFSASDPLAYRKRDDWHKGWQTGFELQHAYRKQHGIDLCDVIGWDRP